MDNRPEKAACPTCGDWVFSGLIDLKSTGLTFKQPFPITTALFEYEPLSITNSRPGYVIGAWKIDGDPNLVYMCAPWADEEDEQEPIYAMHPHQGDSHATERR
jgi:hypothetical protein